MASFPEDSPRLVGERYGERAVDLRWLGPEEVPAAEEARYAILSRLSSGTTWAYHGTKPFAGGLSPGCRSCGDGSWSCLFVNGRCKAGCFFCPSEQREVGVPETNGLRFERPEAYSAYLARFGFRGVSLSGGEPLGTFERTLRFLRAARSSLGPEGHLWLYSNGRLVDAHRLEALRDEGLDELRLNLVASRYDLAPARLAARRLGRVTVEIPAIPEDLERLLALLEHMAEAGVRHLNLHQLRLTPHNLPAMWLRRRGYTFLHGPEAVVLESELAALRAIERVASTGLPLEVNYCSFVFKHRHQRAGARRRAAELLRRPYEEVTETGAIRMLLAAGTPLELAALGERLGSAGVAGRQWAMAGGALAFHPDVADVVRASGVRICVEYSEAALCPRVTYRGPFVKIPLQGGQEIVAERWVAAPRRELEPAEAGWLLRTAQSPLGAASELPPPWQGDAPWWMSHERIRGGLQDYAESAAFIARSPETGGGDEPPLLQRAA